MPKSKRPQEHGALEVDYAITSVSSVQSDVKKYSWYPQIFYLNIGFYGFYGFLVCFIR